MAPTGSEGGMLALIVQFLPFVAIFVLFYFLLIRPQQKRAKAHLDLVNAVKRGDTVVLSSGMIGKVTRVENEEAMVEVAQGVNVRVVKSMIADVRNRTAIAANDTKPAAKA
jgi:preprotein translocase subunit YajC